MPCTGRERIEALLEGTPQHTVESFQAMHGDCSQPPPFACCRVPAKDRIQPPAGRSATQAPSSRGDARRLCCAAIYTAWTTRYHVRRASAWAGACFETLYGSAWFRDAVEGMLERNDTNPGVPGGLRGVASAARAGPCARSVAAEANGDDVAAWRWGEPPPRHLHPTPLSNVKALAPLIEVSTPTGGDSPRSMGQYLDKLDALFANNRHAASLRAIYDSGRHGQPRVIYQTGRRATCFPRSLPRHETWARWNTGHSK
jgi:penicillin amidase